MSAVEQQTKTCTKCEETKSLDEFNRHSRSQDGRQWNCRQCVAEAYRSYIKMPVGNIPEPTVPMSALAPLIQRWRKENTISKLVEFYGVDAGSGWVNRLSELSGISTRYLRSIVTGGKLERTGKWITWVSFDTADKLTTAMDCNEEWTEGGSLNPWYGPLSVKKYERHLAGVE
jgi:hypothetical protein